MNTLFPIDPVFPDGFSYINDFIDETTEKHLCEEICKIDLQHFNFQGFKANRKTASFGYDYSFDKGALNKGKPIPIAFDFLINKVASRLDISNTSFSELLVTEYPPGSVINWHRDAPPFDIIAGISLMSDCVFRLRPHEKALHKRSSIISLEVRRRSLYVIRDTARTDWQHSINPVPATRYSITLRTLRD